ARLVQEAVHPEANIIFGAVIDDTLGDEVRVTVIAAGFDGGEPQPLDESARKAGHTAASLGAAAAAIGIATSPTSSEALDSSDFNIEELVDSAVWSADSGVVESVVADPAFADDNEDIDIPDFLK
ncbi:MAG: cell division protein FtsZ, partial [Leifsonia sp.]